MFTGIIQTVAKITRVGPLQADTDAGLQLTLQCDPSFLNGVKLGDSIAIQGACMTVTTLQTNGFTVDVSVKA